MSNLDSSFLESVRNPAYTGANRCIPCTVVNVVIAAVIGGLASLLAIELGIVLFALSVLLIYVRGYLVPGTPELTKRYMPERIHRLFAEHPTVAMEADEPTWETLEKIREEREHAVDPEEFLLDIGAVEPCESEDDICLTDAFLERFESHLAILEGTGVDTETLATMFDTDPASVTDQNRSYPAYKIDIRIRKWPSDGALVTDVATHHALTDLTDRWLEVPIEQRVKIIEIIRYFHDTCPLCSGSIEISDDVVESCCGRFKVIAIGCASCGERFVELDPTSVSPEAEDHGLRP